MFDCLFLPSYDMLPKLVVYNIYSCIICKKNILCIIRTEFFKFVAVKFIQNVIFIQLFIGFISTKNKNLYSLYYILKYKIYTVLRAKARTCSYENETFLLKISLQ